MKKPIIGILIAIVLIGGGYLLLTQNRNNSLSSSSSGSSASASATITYSDSGFGPATTTVKSGQSITIKNTSSNTIQMQSDPHPVHTDDPDLNVGTVAAGESKTFMVTKVGTYGFHNHLNPSDTANVVVE